MADEFTCTQVAGAKQTIVTPIDQLMIDVGDGTYTQSFSVQINGALTIIIKLIDGNGVYWEWYANTSLSGTPEKKNVTSNLYFYEPGVNWVSLPGGDNYYTAYFQSTIRPPTTEVYTFYVGQDDGAKTIFNGNTMADHFGQNIVTTDIFTKSLNAGQSYSLVIYFLETWGDSYFNVFWSTPTIPYQLIPKTYFFYTKKVASSPYQITVNWPYGYTGSNPSSPTKWITQWGDGIKMGTEVCDDGNTISGDGCSADWGAIETGFICSGSVWTAWTNGKSPDSPKTSWIIQCGDSLRAGSEVCDDGNTSSGDGWSSNCLTIESGYAWTGGSLTSKDTCTLWSAGFYPDSTKASWITVWGDGLRAGSEVWDDANTSSGDGCSSDCTSIETNYIWTGGSTTSKDYWSMWNISYTPNSAKNQWVTVWGDGRRAGSEAWDDANTSSGDGCSNNCTSIETNYIWTGGSTISKDTWLMWSKYYTPSSTKNQCVPIWGDGYRASPEAWDDGNKRDGDGWPSDCKKIDSGWVCFGGEFGLIDIWTKCDVGYNTNIDFSSCIGAEVPRDTQHMATAAMFAALFGTSTSVIVTLFSSSSSASSNSFGMMNQIQLVIIFPLIGPYLPEKIYDYLKSMSTSLFNLNFLPTSNTESTINFKSLFDYKQQNSYLYLLQLQSGSAFVNILDLTTTVGFAICVHVILLILYAALQKLNKLQWLKNIVLKVIKMLSFGFYIGVWLEIYLLFWIVDFSEIHYQRKNGIQNIKSTVMSYVILALMLLFILLALWQWCKAKTTEGLEKLKYFKLLVDDMKPMWICRAYWLIFLLRRTVFLIIIFFTDELVMIGKVILFVVIQTAYLSYIAVLRPNAGFKENLIDFINEVFYFYFVGFMLYYNSEDRWNDTVTDVYFWIMMSNNFVLMFVLFCKFAF